MSARHDLGGICSSIGSVCGLAPRDSARNLAALGRRAVFSVFDHKPLKISMSDQISGRKAETFRNIFGKKLEGIRKFSESFRTAFGNEGREAWKPDSLTGTQAPIWRWNGQALRPQPPVALREVQARECVRPVENGAAID